MSAFIDKINAERAQKGLPPVTGTAPYTSQLGVGTAFDAFQYGARDMFNSMFMGGGAQLLDNLGKAVEYVSPFSGEGITDNDREILRSLGYTHEKINEMYPHRDSWFSSGAKALRETGVDWRKSLRQGEQEALGNNPDPTLRAIRGSGTSLAFMLAGLGMAAAGGSPFAAAAAMGVPEAIAESGGTILDAEEQGKYDNGGLAAANKSFLTNAPLNTLLDWGLGWTNPLAGKIKNPVTRWAAKGASSVLNELLQEPSQEVISEAAMNSLNNGTGYLGELLNSAQRWPEYASQLAPEVTGSTLITHGLMSFLPGSFPGSLAHEFRYNNLLEQGQRNAQTLKSNVDDFVENPNDDPFIKNVKEDFNEAQQKEYDSLQTDLGNTIQNLNNIGYNNYGGLQQNLAHLENIQRTLSNYGHTANEIKLRTIQEQQRQAAVAAQQAAIQEAERQRRERKNAAQAEHLRQLHEQVVAENTPVGAITPTRQLKALPAAQNPATEIKQQPVDETPDIVKGAQNNTDRVRTSAGTKADIRYRVMEADDLITSNDDGGKVNPAYKQEYQGRRRSSDASQLQIARIANAPDPELLAKNPLASDGAPIIDKNRMVISGNGRTLGVRRGYKQGTANGYRAWITEHASEFGINPDYVAKMKNPVLVREITSDVADMAKFASEANESSVSTMSATDKAKSNADLITAEDLVDYDFNKKLEGNKKFINQIISKMPAADKAGLIQANGNPSAEGIERVRQALIAKAYNDTSILDRLTELPDEDDDIAAVSNGLLAAAPQMAKFENSNIRPDLSITENIKQAVNILADLKSKDESVEGYLSTLDMFDETPDETKKLLEFMGTKKKNKRNRSAKAIAQLLTNYAKEAMQEAQAGQGTLTGDTVRSKGEILDKVLNDIYEEEEKHIEVLETRRERRRQLQILATRAAQEKANPNQNTTVENLRQNVEKMITDVGHSQEARALSELYIKWEQNFAKIQGISLEQSLAAERLRFEKHDKLPIRDKAGHLVGYANARITFENGEAILKVANSADQSSILHEFGHLFLTRILNLAKSGNLKGMLKKDFDALLAAYKMTEQDLAKSPKLFTEFHERFATDFERYMRTGKAPSKGLKHAFEVFKRWLKSIYESAKDVTYVDRYGKHRSQVLSKEARQFFNYMLGDEVEADTEQNFNQIGKKRKEDMNTQLAKNRPDMTIEQRAETISEIEKLGESVQEGGNPKVEKLAIHWVLGGHIILPEDNYKILDAIRICEQQHLDPMTFGDPNEILAKYTIKETKAEQRINPDTVPEFSNKIDYGNGITVYTVEDSKKGQSAVRRIINTHLGEKSNPWCLAALRDGTLDKAWELWNSYNRIPKRIAFKDGKLVAFCASSEDKIQWWDTKDEASEEIAYDKKENGYTYKYLFNEKTRKTKKIITRSPDGIEYTYFTSDSDFSTFAEYRECLSKYKEGYQYRIIKSQRHPNGVNVYYYANGNIESITKTIYLKEEWRTAEQTIEFYPFPGKKPARGQETQVFNEDGTPIKDEGVSFDQASKKNKGKNKDESLRQRILNSILGDEDSNVDQKRTNSPFHKEYKELLRQTVQQVRAPNLEELRTESEPEVTPDIETEAAPKTDTAENAVKEEPTEEIQKTLTPKNDQTTPRTSTNNQLIEEASKNVAKRYQSEKKKREGLSTPQKIIKWFKDFFTGKDIDEKEKQRREALVNSVPLQRTPHQEQRKSYQIAEGSEQKTTQENSAPEPEYESELKTETDEKMFSLSDDLLDNDPDLSFGDGDERVEKRYKGADPNTIRGSVKKVVRGIKDMMTGLKGSYAELQGKDENGNNLWKAKTLFDQLEREKHKMVNDAMDSFTNNLKGLSAYQFDLFRRKRLVDDLKWRIEEFEKQGKGTPGLPYGWSKEVFDKDYTKITAVAERPKNKAVMDAVKAEEKAMRKIALDFVNEANKLGIKLGNRFPNPHYYRHVVLEYAEAAAEAQREGKKIKRTRQQGDIQDFVDAKLKSVLNRSWLKKYKGSDLDISSNYVQAMGEVRAQMLIDTATMRTLSKIKEEYDVAPKYMPKIKKALEQKQGAADGANFNQAVNNEDTDVNELLPDGYAFFSPAGSGLVQSGNSVTENAFAQAFNDISDKTGVPIEDILTVAGLGVDEFAQETMILPQKVKEALSDMAKRRNKRESILGHYARKITSLWKADVLFNPLRNPKYNIRNSTGDLDAIIAGTGMEWVKYTPKAFKDLKEHWKTGKASTELQDYLDRAGGRLMVQTIMFSDAEIAALEKQAELPPDAPMYKKAWAKATNPIKKFFAWEHKATEYRENFLRYTAYLMFLDEMDKNNGVPTRWAASNKDEILAIADFRGRAYEMANDLLGAYDKISDAGKEMRSLLMPFWSWQEVNMKRYCQIFKNGLSGDNTGNFTMRFLMGKAARIPYWGVWAASTTVKVMLLNAMIQAFNRFVTGDADDELPEDVKYRPHITFGSWGGKTWYFDRIGALADALDWFSLDSFFFFLDAKEFANGQQSLGGWLKKAAQAPVNKFVGQLNPYLKMPIELATGRSLYPNAFQSKQINDSLEHIARSLGVEWPYKEIRRVFTGKSMSTTEEATKMLLYSIDPEEAAYFNALDKVRQFNERVLDKHFEGFASTKRGTALRNMKTAMRYKDYAGVRRFLREYRELDGTPQGLKQSMKAMNPLFGMNEKDKKQFMRWITPNDRKTLRMADRYWKALAGKYIR